jgi:hypothetical protein
MKEHLKEMYQNLVHEFRSIAGNIYETQKFWGYIKNTFTPAKSDKRYADGHTIEVIQTFNQTWFSQILRSSIQNLKSTQNIIQWIGENGYWFRDYSSIEDDIHRIPSISNNYIAGFLIRNFELNNFELIITEQSFHQSFEELYGFLLKDNFEVTSLLILHGPDGNLDEIKLSDTASIIAANKEISVLFNRYYAIADNHYCDMFPGDYVLKLRTITPKSLLTSFSTLEHDEFDKWFLVAVTAGIGNIEKGKIVRISGDWAAMNIPAPMASHYNLNRYSKTHPSDYHFTNDGVPLIERAIQVISETKPEMLDNNLSHAIKRIIKSKKASTIDDKVVELALALEYLINTERFEINLQLKAKGTILHGEKGKEDETYKTIGEFYSLRSAVVHGHSSLKKDEKNKIILEKSEVIILTILLRMIELNNRYSYKEISEALKRSMYMPASLDDLLEQHA